MTSWSRSTPSPPTGRLEVDKIALRKQEALTGDYNWASAFQQSLVDPHVDIANHVSPDLAIKKITDEGRSLFAARPIKAGSLLMVQKPLVSSYHNKVLKDNRSILSVNLFNETVERTTQVDLKRRLTARLMDDPSLAACVDRLYAGPQYPIPSRLRLVGPSAQGGRRHDLARSHRLVQARGRADVQLVLASETRRHVQGMPRRRQPSTHPHEQDRRSPSALYLLPSLINHSCTTYACALPILRPFPSARCDALTLVRAPTDRTGSYATPSLLERGKTWRKEKKVRPHVRPDPFRSFLILQLSLSLSLGVTICESPFLTSSTEATTFELLKSSPVDASSARMTERTPTPSEGSETPSTSSSTS